MATILRHKLLNIPVMLVNFVNSKSYDSSDLHKFHSTDKGEIGYKNYCKKCFKDVENTEIIKGTDAEHILTESQQERLKEALDNQTIEILGFEYCEELNLNSIMPLIQKSMLILPSISKGYKNRDIEIFFSFKEAIKSLNVFLKVKYISRAKEHLGIIFIDSKENLIFLELPYFSKLNYDEINRLREQVSNLQATANLKDFATDYIKANIKPLDLNLEKEKKAILIKQYLEQAITGEVEQEPQEINNPFVIQEKI